MPGPTNYGQQVSMTGVCRFEKVSSAVGGDGKWHYIDRQNLHEACGPACARMVVQMMTGKRIGESYFTALVGFAEAGHAPSAVNPLSAQAQGLHDFSVVGTVSQPVLKALQDNKIQKARKAVAVNANWSNVWRACSEKTPAIAGFFWVNGGGHFIVVAGPLGGSNDRILILDPWYGVQQLDLSAPTTYQPRMGGGNLGLVQATGNLAGDHVILTY